MIGDFSNEVQAFTFNLIVDVFISINIHVELKFCYYLLHK